MSTSGSGSGPPGRWYFTGFFITYLIIMMIGDLWSIGLARVIFIFLAIATVIVWAKDVFYGLDTPRGDRRHDEGIARNRAAQEDGPQSRAARLMGTRLPPTQLPSLSVDYKELFSRDHE